MRLLGSCGPLLDIRILLFSRWASMFNINNDGEVSCHGRPHLKSSCNSQIDWTINKFSAYLDDIWIQFISILTVNNNGQSNTNRPQVTIGWWCWICNESCANWNWKQSKNYVNTLLISNFNEKRVAKLKKFKALKFLICLCLDGSVQESLWMKWIRILSLFSEFPIWGPKTLKQIWNWTIQPQT